MPDLDPDGPLRNAARRWNPAARTRDYTYRGQGHDSLEAAEAGGCTCTWVYGPPDYRWERIGVKKDCPAEARHQADVAAMQRALDQVWADLEAKEWQL